MCYCAGYSIVNFYQSLITDGSIDNSASNLWKVTIDIDELFCSMCTSVLETPTVPSSDECPVFWLLKNHQKCSDFTRA